MSLLHLATPEDLDRILPLVAAFHAEMGYDTDTAHHTRAMVPLLDGSPHGAVWLIGPRRAPVGYVVICFGWSVEFGGLDAIIDELYIRPGVRGRGVATEALIALPRALSEGGLRAVHLEVDRDNEAAIKLYRRAGFAPRENYMFMSRRL